jgi:hypothetical protein
MEKNEFNSSILSIKFHQKIIRYHSTYELNPVSINKGLSRQETPKRSQKLQKYGIGGSINR